MQLGNISTKAAARVPTGVLAKSSSLSHRSGGARQALPAHHFQKVCFFGKDSHAPPGLFYARRGTAPARLEVRGVNPPSAARPAGRYSVLPLQGHRRPLSRRTPVRFVTPARQPRPIRSLPGDGPPKSPCERIRRSLYGKVMGAWIRFLCVRRGVADSTFPA